MEMPWLCRVFFALRDILWRKHRYSMLVYRFAQLDYATLAPCAFLPAKSKKNRALRDVWIRSESNA